MSSHVVLRCDTAKCGATFTGGVHAPETFTRNAAASQQGWTSRTRIGTQQSWTYDYCREHSKQ